MLLATDSSDTSSLVMYFTQTEARRLDSFPPASVRAGVSVAALAVGSCVRIMRNAVWGVSGRRLSRGRAMSDDSRKRRGQSFSTRAAWVLRDGV